MTKLAWDKSGERFYETGTDHGVLYNRGPSGDYDSGVPWNGLTAVTEAPSGAEANPFYADNIKYLNIMSPEEYGFTIEAYYSPKEFDRCDGSLSPQVGVSVGQQRRESFGFSFRSQIGNDIDGNDFGYKLHLVWNALAAPSERSYATVNDSPEPITLSWEATTTPVEVGTINGVAYRPIASITIDSTLVNSTKLAQFEDILYGTAAHNPRLPSPSEVIEFFNAGASSEVEPTAPTFDVVTGVITIPTVVGVEYRIGGEAVTGTYTVPTGQKRIVKAVPKTGYRFPADTDDDWEFRRA